MIFFLQIPSVPCFRFIGGVGQCCAINVTVGYYDVRSLNAEEETNGKLKSMISSIELRRSSV